MRLVVIAGIGVFCRHAVGVSRLRSVVVAVDANAAAAHCLILSAQCAGCSGGVGVIMVLAFVAEMLVGVVALAAVTTRYAVANELNLALRTGRKAHQGTVLVEDKSPELSLQLIALDDVSQFHMVLARGQCRSQLHYAVLLSGERHLERFGMVNLRHEVTALGLCHHAQRRSGEACLYLHAWIYEHGAERVVDVYSSRVANIAVCGQNHRALGFHWRCAHGDTCHHESDEKNYLSHRLLQFYLFRRAKVKNYFIRTKF